MADREALTRGSTSAWTLPDRAEPTAAELASWDKTFSQPVTGAWLVRCHRESCDWRIHLITCGDDPGEPGEHDAGGPYYCPRCEKRATTYRVVDVWRRDG